MRLYETQDVQVWCEIPSCFQQGWIRSAGTSLFLPRVQHRIVREGASVWCVVRFLSVWCTCIASAGVGFPGDVSLLCWMGDFPVSSSPAGTWGQSHVPAGSIQWYRGQELAVSPGSVLPCQKHPPRVLSVAQEIWEGAEMSDRWSQPLTLPSPLPGRQWKSTYTGWLCPPNSSNYHFC